MEDERQTEMQDQQSSCQADSSCKRKRKRPNEHRCAVSTAAAAAAIDTHSFIHKSLPSLTKLLPTPMPSPMIGKHSRKYNNNNNKNLSSTTAAAGVNNFLLGVFFFSFFFFRGTMSPLPPSFASALTPPANDDAANARRNNNRQSSPSSGNNGGGGRNLRLAVFDLDYTIWQPEMYQLYGKPRLVATSGGSVGGTGRRRANAKKVKTVGNSFILETRTMQEGMMITDGSGSPMRVFPGA